MHKIDKLQQSLYGTNWGTGLSVPESKSLHWFPCAILINIGYLFYLLPQSFYFNTVDERVGETGVTT